MLTTSDEKLAERLLQEDDTPFESLEDINHAVGQRRSGSVHKHTFAVILSLSMSVNLLLSSILLRQAWISQQATNGPVERTIYGKLAVPLLAVRSDFIQRALQGTSQWNSWMIRPMQAAMKRSRTNYGMRSVSTLASSPCQIPMLRRSIFLKHNGFLGIILRESTFSTVTTTFTVWSVISPFCFWVGEICTNSSCLS